MDFIQPPSNLVMSPLSCLHWKLHWKSNKYSEVVHLVCIDSHWFWTMCWCQLDSVSGIFLPQLQGDALLLLAFTLRSYWFYFWPQLSSYWHVWCFGYLPALYSELSLSTLPAYMQLSPHFIMYSIAWVFCLSWMCSCPRMFILSLLPVALMMLLNVAFAIYQV